MPKVIENGGKMDRKSVKIDLGTALKNGMLFFWFLVGFWSPNGSQKGAQGHHKSTQKGAQKRFGLRDPLRTSILMDLGCILDVFKVFV